MEKLLAGADTEALVDIVKLAQKQGMKGEKGAWKEFLASHDTKRGASDPRRRSLDVLVSFLKSFTKKEDIKFFKKALKCYRNSKSLEQLTESVAADESPEQKLIRLTIKHPLYRLYYSSGSFDKGWMATPLCKDPNHLMARTLIAIDCEMVLCEDGTEEVVRVCGVDSNLEVKLDQVVKPNKAVFDYRTKITGMSEKDFKGVTTTLTEVQGSLKRLLRHGTILVGHSLHNDLRALKLDHARVIDTAFIFKCKEGDTFKMPSLNNLCKYVLGSELRKEGASHNCLEDARAAMNLVLAKLNQGFDDPIDFPKKEATEEELSKLLLHGVPKFVPSEDLKDIFPKDSTVEIQPVSKVNGQKYSTLAVFKDPVEAEDVFERLKGKQEKDTSGRPQKLVSIELSNEVSAFLYVRKMRTEAFPVPTSCKRTSDTEEGTRKKPKGDYSDQCANHIKEIERLKNELRQREDEILNLQKIIAAVTRKHGL